MYIKIVAIALAASIATTVTWSPLLGGLCGSAVSSEQRIAKNLDAKPPIGGTGGSLGMDKPLEWVPPLEGKDPNDPTVIEDFIAGTGFSIKIVGYKSSSTVRKGAIISQVPKPYTEVKKPGKIEVIISSGPRH